MNDLLNNIINKDSDSIIYTAIISSLNPLQVKFYSGDDSINVKCTSNLLGLKMGSNVIMIKIQNKYIIIGVIQDSPYPIGYVEYIIKQTDDIRNNTTTLQNDSELTLTIPPNGIYEMETRLFVDAVSSTPEFKMDYTYSNLTQLQYRNCLGLGTSSTSAYNADYMHFHSRSMATDTIYGTAGSGWASVWEKFIVRTGDDEGSITLRHAQNVATVEDVKVKANSLMKFTKINNYHA